MQECHAWHARNAKDGHAQHSLHSCDVHTACSRHGDSVYSSDVLIPGTSTRSLIMSINLHCFITAAGGNTVDQVHLHHCLECQQCQPRLLHANAGFVCDCRSHALKGNLQAARIGACAHDHSKGACTWSPLLAHQREARKQGCTQHSRRSAMLISGMLILKVWLKELLSNPAKMMHTGKDRQILQ